MNIKFVRRMKKFYLVIVSLLILIYLKIRSNNKPVKLSYVDIKNIQKIDRSNYPNVVNFEKIDWNDWDFIKYEKARVGLGENGTGVTLNDPKDIEMNQKINEEEGLSGWISDKISVNRSLPDFMDVR